MHSTFFANGYEILQLLMLELQFDMDGSWVGLRGLGGMFRRCTSGREQTGLAGLARLGGPGWEWVGVGRGSPGDLGALSRGTRAPFKQKRVR